MCVQYCLKHLILDFIALGEYFLTKNKIFTAPKSVIEDLGSLEVIETKKYQKERTYVEFRSSENVFIKWHIKRTNSPNDISTFSSVNFQRVSKRNFSGITWPITSTNITPK